MSALDHIEWSAHTRLRSSVRDEVQSLQVNLQANAERSPFILPTAYLRAFEAIDNEPERNWFMTKFKEEVECGLAARRWYEVRDEAAKVEASTKPPPGSLTEQFEMLQKLDPPGARKFFDAHRSEIAAEHEHRRLHGRETVTETL